MLPPISIAPPSRTLIVNVEDDHDAIIVHAKGGKAVKVTVARQDGRKNVPAITLGRAISKAAARGVTINDLIDAIEALAGRS